MVHQQEAVSDITYQWNSMGVHQFATCINWSSTVQSSSLSFDNLENGKDSI